MERLDRNLIFEKIQHRSYQPVDFVVIGGGASGLGIAWDAASRGYTVILLEKNDFCHATSSRSTKLIHGGVRYLQQGNISLVKEALYERAAMLRMAPHLSRPLRFMIPAYHWSQLPYYATGLTLYDLLAGSRGLGVTRWETSDAVRKSLPGLRINGLKGGISYTDGVFDDARFGISLVKSVASCGGLPLNYAAVNTLLKNASGKVTGVGFTDGVTGTYTEIHAKVVINATGIFAESIMQMDAVAPPLLRYSRGAHIVVDASFLPSRDALMIPKTTDGRVLFAVPWHGKILLGTTDVSVDEVNDDPQPSPEEIDFILDNAGKYLETKPGKKDIKASFAGLRPLFNSGRTNTKDISRAHKVVVSPSGLIHILGGKWTIFRKMAEDTVDIAIREARLFPKPCKTKTLFLADMDPAATLDSRYKIYGTAGKEIAEKEFHDPGSEKPVSEAFAYSRAEITYIMESEMVVKPEDLLFRRLRCGFIDTEATSELKAKLFPGGTI